jgi:hypothetical protein
MNSIAHSANDRYFEDIEDVLEVVALRALPPDLARRFIPRDSRRSPRPPSEPRRCSSRRLIPRGGHGDGRSGVCCIEGWQDRDMLDL